jgi:hypothetical protein
MSENFEFVYQKDFSKQVAMVLYFNTEDNKYHVFTRTEIAVGASVVQTTGQIYEAWEEQTAIQDIEMQYEAYRDQLKQQMEEAQKTAKFQPNSIEELRHNMREMALYAQENMRCH